MHVMNDRDLISFKVKEEDYKYQEDVIIPYWEKRSIRKKTPGQHDAAVERLL